MSQFQGKVALVTGGGTGIGKAITQQFVAGGAKVVVTGRRVEPLQALKREYPGQVDFIQADVTKAGDPEKAIDFAISTFGQLDVLVNNAGTFLHKPLVETTNEEIAHVFNVNVSGVLAFTRAAVPYLSKTKGNVITTSSVVATAVMPGTSVYSASKAAVDHLTRLLAAELGAVGIRVNAVSPGVTRTDMATGFLSQEGMEAGISSQTPLGRIGEATDIARAVGLIASDDAGWVTGQIVAASGGFML